MHRVRRSWQALIGAVAALQTALAPARATLEIQPFFGGDRPTFPDYCLFGAFMWALRSGQFDDLEGAGQRILFDDEDEERTKADR